MMEMKDVDLENCQDKVRKNWKLGFKKLVDSTGFNANENFMQCV